MSDVAPVATLDMVRDRCATRALGSAEFARTG
jgi:hypothetical protein